MIGNWSLLPEYLLLGSLGAASIEWLKGYELKHRHSSEKFRQIQISLLYWGKFILFLLASGFIAWAINENNPNATVWQVVISGAGANALVNKGVEARLSKENLFAGGEQPLEQILHGAAPLKRAQASPVTFRDLF